MNESHEKLPRDIYAPAGMMPAYTAPGGNNISPPLPYALSPLCGLLPSTVRMLRSVASVSRNDA